MPTPSQQLLSRTIYDVDGTTTVWNFAFSGGYIDPSHVKAYTELPNGIRTPIVVTPEMLIGEFQLQVVPALPPSAGLLVIYRDTPKDLPLVDFVEGPLSEVALDTNARQAVFIAAEAQDEFASTNYQIAVDAASAAVASAAQANIDASTAASASSAAASASSAASSSALIAANAATAAASAVADLAATSGAAMVGSDDGAGGARFSTVAGAIDDLINGVTGLSVNVASFPWLAKCDGVTDDTAAVNAAVLRLANAGGGKLQWPTGSTCRILGKVWVVSHVHYDLNGAKLVGGGVDVGTMFETAYLNAGVLTSSIGTPYQSHVVKYARIGGGLVESVGQLFNLQNFNMGCKVHDLELFNARQFGAFDACFYAHFDTVFHSGGTVDTIPSFHFKSANNAIKLNKVVTTCEWCYHFQGGGTAIAMSGCSQEGGSKGIKITGDILGLTITGNYAEAIPGTWLDLTDAGNTTIDIAGNYFNYVDVVVNDGGGSAGPLVLGRWAASNQIVNVNGETGGFTYRGRMQVSARLNLVEYELNNDVLGAISIPAHWVTSTNTNISFSSTATFSSITDYRKKALIGNGLIPLRFSGDTGPIFSGFVPFCAVTLGTTSHIDTKIKWQPHSLFAKFSFNAHDGNGFHTIYGDIYGAQFKRQDADPMVMTISDNGGFLRLSLTQTAPPFASVSGTVQICT